MLLYPSRISKDPAITAHSVAITPQLRWNLMKWLQVFFAFGIPGDSSVHSFLLQGQENLWNLRLILSCLRGLGVTVMMCQWWWCHGSCLKARVTDWKPFGWFSVVDLSLFAQLNWHHLMPSIRFDWVSLFYLHLHVGSNGAKAAFDFILFETNRWHKKFKYFVMQYC